VRNFGDFWNIGMGSVFGEELFPSPPLPVQLPPPLTPPQATTPTPRPPVSEATERLARLEGMLTELSNDGYAEATLSPLREEMRSLQEAFAGARAEAEEAEGWLGTAAAEAAVAAESTAAAADSAEATVEDSSAPGGSGFESILERVGMLSLALSRSGTRQDSPRRIRLLQQLEASVEELQAEGFDDAELLEAWNAQVRVAWASVPPEVLAQEAMRRAQEKAEGSSFLERAGQAIGDAADLSLGDVLESIGESLPAEVDFDVAKWRLRLTRKYRKKYVPKENRDTLGRG